MALIIREKIEKPVTETFCELQEKIVENGKLTEMEIKDYVYDSGLYKKIKDEVDYQVQSAIDEYDGQKRDREEDAERDRIIAERRAYIEDFGILDVPTKRRRVVTDRSLRNYSNLLGIPVTAPTKDIFDCSDDEIMNHSSDSEHWLDYRAKLYKSSSEESENSDSDVSVNEDKRDKFSKLIHCSRTELKKFLIKECESLQDLYYTIKEIERKNVTPENFYDIKFAIEIVAKIQGVELS